MTTVFIPCDSAALAAGGVLWRGGTAADPPVHPQGAAPVDQRSRRDRAGLVGRGAELLSRVGGEGSGLTRWRGYAL